MKNKYKNSYVFFVSDNFIIYFVNISNSNNIYLIDSGEVIDYGKHDDLLLKSELYKNFYEKQIQK